MKNPEKMSKRELRDEVVEWRKFGHTVIDGIEDWSSGRADQTVYIPKTREYRIRELIGRELTSD